MYMLSLPFSVYTFAVAGIVVATPGTFYQRTENIRFVAAFAGFGLGNLLREQIAPV